MIPVNTVPKADAALISTIDIKDLEVVIDTEVEAFKKGFEQAAPIVAPNDASADMLFEIEESLK